MNAHPQDLKARAEIDEAAFVAGVALFDEMLREAERLSHADETACAGVWIEAGMRHGAPLNLFALSGLQQLLQHPDQLSGFAAAIGDYIGSNNQGLAPGDGPQFERLQFDDVWIAPEPAPVAPPVSKMPTGWRAINGGASA